MILKEMKQAMLEWTDFYGGDIPDKEAIKNAKSKEELKELCNSHRRLMEDMLCDAIKHIDEFKKEIGL